MYQYTQEDQAIIDGRVAEFRDQVKRYKAGKIDDKEFLNLRLRNGLYMQKHAYMLRVAIPYGLLSSKQMRMLGHIARKYDKGYGHFTTRQNIQYNWPELEAVPDILADLASVEMHAVQTSGNCVRNNTLDHFAGVSADEVEDPRPYAEIVRQWSTFHPEFNYLPRKFKIAFTGCLEDNAAIAYHDIGVRMVRNEGGRVGCQIIVGGGMGRTPIIGPVIKPFLEKEHLLSYIDAILRAYNMGGNRKNKYKARIKIQVRTMKPQHFAALVEDEFAKTKDGPLTLSKEDIQRFVDAFKPMPYQEGLVTEVNSKAMEKDGFAKWVKTNVHAHKVPGYSIAFISLKSEHRPPGDITDSQMEFVADLADTFNFGEVQTTHDQNLVFKHVETGRLHELYEALSENELGSANIGLLTDMICCPGGDFCSLANAKSLPIAKEISERFSNTDKLHQIGEVKLKMSGCINACGHHHAGHIGVLGIDRKGEEVYQILMGGSAGDDTSIGKWIGPAITQDKVALAVEQVTDVYLNHKKDDERLLDTYRRIGKQPFHDRIYVEHDGAGYEGDEA